MDITQVYAIVIGGSFGLLLLINSLPLIARLVRYLSPRIKGPDLPLCSSPTSASRPVESSRCLGAADLHRREYMLLQVLGYHHLASRTPSRDTRDDQPDPTVRPSSPRHSRGSAGCDPQYVSADPPVGRCDGGCACHFPRVSHGSLAALLSLTPASEPVRGHSK
jgi:hypothetical protein